MFKRKTAPSSTSARPTSPNARPELDQALARILDAMLKERNDALVASINEVSDQFGGFPPDLVRSALVDAFGSRQIEASQDDVEIIAKFIADGVVKKIRIEDQVIQLPHHRNPG